MTETDKELLQQVLERHKHWLQKDCYKWEEMKADLSDADLRGADLRGANLSDADLSNADLSSADLRNASLSNTDLSGANLIGADLRYADLSDANLSGADLRNADLREADLSNADLSNADLRGADIRYAKLNNADLNSAYISGANLRYTDLRHADLNNADLKDANLSNADLRYANNIPYIPMVCPEEGEFIGWKKAGQTIIKLHIPEDALRSSATTRKCRCSKAEVIEIYNLDGTISKQRCVNSNRDSSFVYRVGETVNADDFDKDRWNECSSGIHFFINRQEAVEYDYS